MTQKAPGFFERLSLALQVLFSAEIAARVREPAAPALAPPSVEPRVVEKIVEKVVEKPVDRVVEKIVETSNSADGALVLLSVLQRDGRLVDFLQEDIRSAGDADVGAAARIVHEGCKKALAQYFTLGPVKSEGEGSAVTVEKGFDPNQIRLAGNVSGEPPYKGRLAHAGWKAIDVRLPEKSPAVAARIVAPAEVEI